MALTLQSINICLICLNDKLFATAIHEDPMGLFYGICDKYVDICFNITLVKRTNRLKEMTSILLEKMKAEGESLRRRKL